jgi:DNA helicase-2/ATP-dependent DNA helicase PcrA
VKEFVLKQSLRPSSLRIDYRKELNDEQLDVVIHGDGPCLVLAGAGSGKTRTITYRVAYLIEQGIAPEHILLLTFTNKAAREMLSRVDALLGTQTHGLPARRSFREGGWGGTFHSVANRMLRMYAQAVQHTPNFTILDQEDAKDLVTLCTKELGIDPKERRFPSPSILHGLVSYARNAAKTMQEAVERKHPHFFDLLPTLEQIAERYEARKREINAMDFDDLLLLLRKLLTERPDIHDRLANQFQYILVDEYQDTNVIQAEIVRALASVHGNLLVVGDDAQSIYSFRAAEIRNILAFPKLYSGARVFRLTTNYRSTPEILGLANSVIAQNRDQFQKKLTAVHGSREKPQLVPMQNAQEEARYIAERLLLLRDEGMKLNAMAVLFRAAFLSQALEFELMKRDVPYDYRGGMKFFERAHIKDVVAHLRVIANHKDEMAWMRVLGLQPGFGLVTSEKVIGALRSFETLEQVLDAPFSLGARAEQGWRSCWGVIQKAAACDGRASDMIRAVIAGSYRDYLETEYQDYRDRLDDLEQFALFAEGAKDLKSFLDEVSLTETFGARGPQLGTEDEERVVLSTIHQAKGLEWDAVFVMGLTDSAFPNPRALEEDGGIEEERRLFYVASTRARRYLFLTYAVSSGYDTLVMNRPSRFVQELPDGVCEEVTLRRTLMSSRSAADFHDDPTIVLDGLGEPARKMTGPPRDFLRDY